MKVKRKTNIKDSIIFTIVTLATLWGILYALLMVLTLIDFLTL
tara:strand:- start:51 stop:179 length:129 start_codon:yes stop_codon:yes gene_type:complete